MIVISNTSPLIALSRIRRLDIYQKFFGRLMIPSFVYRELVENCPYPEQKRYIEDAMRKFIDVVPTRLNRSFSRNIAEGEQSVLNLALEINPDILLIDDKKARKEAQELGYMPSYTTDVIQEAEKRGIIDSYSALMHELYFKGIYLPGR